MKPPCLNRQRHLLPIERQHPNTAEGPSPLPSGLMAGNSSKNNFRRHAEFEVLMRHPRLHRNLNSVREAKPGLSSWVTLGLKEVRGPA